MKKQLKPPRPPAPGILIHVLVGLLFLIVGAAAFYLRSRTMWPQPLGLDLLDAIGTVCWSGVLTTGVSLMLRRNRGWAPWTWVISSIMSLGVEFLQATAYPAYWQSVFPPSHLVFGSAFSWADVPWYLVGVAGTWWVLNRGFPPADVHHDVESQGPS